MASEEKKQRKKQVFDVAKPGKTPAEASSRPIIISHKPLVEDPMVSKKSEQTDPDDKPSGIAVSTSAGEVVSHGGKVVQPPQHEEVETDKSSHPAETVNDADNSIEPETKEQAKTESTSQASVEINAAADELEQKNVKQEADAKESKQEAELQERISKLIEEKKYFVKIGETRRHKSASTGIMLFLLLLVVAGLYLAVDAELIKTSISLPYDFIK